MKREKINFLLKKMSEVRKLYRNERIIYEKYFMFWFAIVY